MRRPTTLLPYPNFPDKHLGSPLVTPQRFLDYARTRGQLADFEPPAGVLLLSQRSAMASLIQREQAEQLPVLGQYPLYTLPRTGGVVGLVGNFGIGGPMVGILVEELAALGVRSFFSFGLAGGLQPHSRVGDIVVCTRAIRDEGVSHTTGQRARSVFQGLLTLLSEMRRTQLTRLKRARVATAGQLWSKTGKPQKHTRASRSSLDWPA